MSGVSHQTAEMKEKKEKDSEATVARKKKSPENAPGELEQKIWSVITFDSCAASGLTYNQAAEKLEKLKAENVSGLCVVTDETAARINAGKK